MITRLEVNNYRCLRYNKIEIPPFAALVGPNAAGKSTFVDALRMLSGLMEIPIDRALFFNGYAGEGRCSAFEEILYNRQGSYFEIAVEILVPAEFQHGSFNRLRYEIEVGPKKSALANLIDDPGKFPLATWTRNYLREGIAMLVLNSRAMRIIALTLIAFLPETALTYLIEEPGNGIHPKALEMVMEALSATNNVHWQGEIPIETLFASGVLA